MAKKLSDLPGTKGGRVGSFRAAMYEVARFVNEIGRDFTPVYSQLYHIWKFPKTLLWRRPKRTGVPTVDQLWANDEKLSQTFRFLAGAQDSASSDFSSDTQ